MENELSRDEIPFELHDVRQVPTADLKAVFRLDRRLVESKYDVTALEQKLVFLAISELRQEADLVSFVFDLPHVCDLLGMSDYNSRYDDLTAVVKRLMSRVIEVQTSPGVTLLSHWVQEAKVDRAGKTLTLDLSPRLRPFLLQLHARYTEFRLEDLMALSGKYTIRFYEVFQQGRFGKDVWVVQIPILRMREMFEWKRTEYKQSSEIRVRVVQPAMDELNRLSPLYVTFEPMRKGNAVTGWEFTITLAPKTEAPRPAEERKADWQVRMDLYAKAPAKLRAMIDKDVETVLSNGTFPFLGGDDLEGRRETALLQVLRDYEAELKGASE